jgi:hypothetical protein
MTEDTSMNSDIWLHKYAAYFVTAYLSLILTGTVCAQDSIKVPKYPQANAVSRDTVAPPQTKVMVNQPTAASPAVTQLSVTSIAEIEDQARMDAQIDIKGQTWFLIGCLTNLTGWLIAYIVEPSPPVSKLLGKSSDYIAVYTDAYKREGKKIQTKKAFTGCVVGVLCVVVVELFVFLVVGSATSSSPNYYN